MSSLSCDLSSWTLDGNRLCLDSDIRNIIETREKSNESTDWNDHHHPLDNNEDDTADFLRDKRNVEKEYNILLVNMNSRFFSPPVGRYKSLSPLSKYNWTQVTWMDCDGLVDPMFQFGRLAKKLILYRVAPPRASLLDVSDSDATAEEKGENEKIQNDTQQQNDFAAAPEPLSGGRDAQEPRISVARENILLSSMWMIQVLSLEHCVLDEVSVGYLSAFLSSPHASASLTSISFRSCFFLSQNICVDLLAQGFSMYQKNRDCILRNNNDCANETSLQERHTLTDLNQVSFHWSNIIDCHVARLISSLPQSVESLDMAGNLCRTQGMIVLAEKWLEPVAVTNQKKKSLLRLREQCIDTGSNLDIRPLATTAALYATVIHLDLSVNRLTDSDMILLSDALATKQVSDGHISANPSSLQILDVRSNQITDFGVKALCRISTLRQLWLQDNEDITQMGVEFLCEAAKSFGNLGYVGLSIGFGSSLSTELEYYAALNWGGRRLVVNRDCNASTSVPLGIWPLVLARASKHDGMDRAANILFCLLRCWPALWAR